MVFSLRSFVAATLTIFMMSGVVYGAQFGNGYILHGQLNPVGKITTSGGSTSLSGGAAINSTLIGGGYRIIGGAYRASGDADGDGVPDLVEGLADGNGDGIGDYLQDSVVTRLNPTTLTPVTISATGSCQIFESARVLASSSLPLDSAYTYPVGFLDYDLSCTAPGDTAQITVYYTAGTSTTGWVYRKYFPLTSTYTTLSQSLITLSLSTLTSDPLLPVGTVKVGYQVGDNDTIFDDDTTLNARISDPFAPALPIPVAPSGGGGGGGGGYFAMTPLRTFQLPFSDINIDTTDTRLVVRTSCELNAHGNWYKYCNNSYTFSSFPDFAHYTACEGFITPRQNDTEYAYTNDATRKEVVAMAVKMKRIKGRNILFLAPPEYKNHYTDIGLPNQSPWIQAAVETGLKYGLVSSQRTLFQPDATVTRAEAFAMLMGSVCATPSAREAVTYLDWREGIVNRARDYGFTSRTFATFDPDAPILRQELFVLMTRAADWAERTGGCEPKLAACEK